MKLQYFASVQTRTFVTYDPYSDMTCDLSCHRIAAWAYMCAHADDGRVIRSRAHSRAPQHVSRRMTRRRTAALQPRAADRAHPAHPRERPPLLRRRFNRRETTKSTRRGQAHPNACASKNHASSSPGNVSQTQSFNEGLCTGLACKKPLFLCNQQTVSMTTQCG